MSARTRRFAAPTLVVAAVVAALLALVVGYVRHAAVSSDQFANRATVALQDSSVRSLIGERVTDQLVLKNRGDLLAARPLIESIVASVVGGRAFTAAFRSGVRDVHRAVFERDEHTLTLTVVDVGTIVAAGLEVVKPSLAKRVRTTARVDLVRRNIGAASAEVARAARTARLLAWLSLLVAVAAGAAALALAGDRRRTVVQLGIGIAIGGAALLLALAIARSALVAGLERSDARDAAGAVWDAFLGDLRTAAWMLAGAGAVVAAAAASLIRPVAIDAPLRRAAVWVTTPPTRPSLQVLRGAALVALGLLLLLDRDIVLQLVFAAAGLYLIYAGVSAILWLVYQPRVATPGRPASTRAPRGRRGRALIAAAVAAVLIGAAVGAFVGSGGTSTAAPASGACDGHAALCDRSLDEVALAATHNAMSVPLPGWYSAEQDRPIANQLQDGIRGLLIDTHYADRLAGGRLRTDIGDNAKLRRRAQEDGVSPSAVDAALRIRKRLGFAGEGTRGAYLCHGFCELGGTPLGAVLDDLHDFLVAHPDEVVVVINEDYITPEDFVAAVQRAGLDRLAYRGPTGRGQWPTLRQMIDRDQRVVFLAENHAGAAPWYHLAYKSITEETPYTFSKPAQLTDPSRLAASCRPNRGPADAPLFLVNHWISTDPIPLPSQAAEVNAYEPLMRRLRACRRIRGHMPNLVAVNFYRQGDLMRAVDALNGVG